MKKIIISLIGSLILSSCVITKGQDGQPGQPGKSPASPHTQPAEANPYNEALAKQLGADDYGMKSYYLAILVTGTSTIEDKTKLQELMRGHLSNIEKLANEGKIVVAGPFLEKNDKNYRGLFILNTDNKETAEQWLMTDPSIAAGVFSFELTKWYGSAALPLYLPKHQEISKLNP